MVCPATDDSAVGCGQEYRRTDGLFKASVSGLGYRIIEKSSGTLSEVIKVISRNELMVCSK